MFTHEETVVSMWRASGVANHEEFVNRRGETQKKELKAEGASLTRIADGKIIENRLYWPRYPFSP
jgi:ketosteroid isomerase-like protein